MARQTLGSAWLSFSAVQVSDATLGVCAWFRGGFRKEKVTDSIEICWNPSTNSFVPSNAKEAR
jgi:hypothetical protein